MGLFQNAVETYDTLIKLNVAGGAAHEGFEPLAPVYHVIKKAQIEMSITRDGKFYSASAMGKSGTEIVIPWTEAAGGRSSTKIAPYPLCEKLEYLVAKNEKKYQAYVSQLEDWCNSEYSHPLARAVLAYVQNGTVLNDLASSGLISDDNEKLPEFICWRVVGEGSDWGACWENKGLMESFSNWYSEKISESIPVEFCMIDGEVQPVCSNNPKGVISRFGNAKLISANDGSGFTYRGRFIEPEEAVSVGLEASQKSHNALRWLVKNRGRYFGNRLFICWNPQGKEIIQAWNPFMNDDGEPILEFPDYQRKLWQVSEGYRSELPQDESVVIAAFEAATTGRLSLVYYNQLMGSDYLDRLKHWEETCCWERGQKGISSPLLRDIARFAFGSPIKTGDKTDFELGDNFLSTQMQRLISCRVDQEKFPRDLKDALVERAVKAPLYGTSTSYRLLFVTCAVIRKYWIDHYGEDVGMSLDKEKADISYQYGRLLAVLECVERDTFGEDDKGRLTNAERMQARYRRQPQAASAQIHQKLLPYFRKLDKEKRGRKVRFDKEIGQIFEQLSQFPAEELKKPLSDTYLLGYYLEKQDLYKPQHTNTVNDEKEN